MGFVEDFKKSWKGYSEVVPDPNLVELLQRSAPKELDLHKIRYVAGLATSVLGRDVEFLSSATYGTYVEGKKLSEMVVCPAILCVMKSRIILFRHTNASSHRQIIDTVEIPTDKVASIWIGKIGLHSSEINIETSTQSIKFRHSAETLESIKAQINLTFNESSDSSKSSSNSQTLTTQLMDLGKMLESGLISEEEFALAKMKILNE